MKILITGGTGFIGSYLIDFFLKEGHHLIVLTRDKQLCKLNNNRIIVYIENLDIIKSSDSIDVIINLAGAPIDNRWTKHYKKLLFNSRINITQNIVKLISRLSNKPKLLISSSAIGYYGAQNNIVLAEDSDFRDCFTHHLCQKWEDTANQAKQYGVRVCIARFGVALGKNGGMLKKIYLPFIFGLGGQLGDGSQYFSWIHIEDIRNIFNLFITHEKMHGIYNLTSPNPVTNQTFTKFLGNQLNRWTFATIPSLMIKILFGEMGNELLLGSNNIIPKRLLDSGYDFKFPTINLALEQIYPKN